MSDTDNRKLCPFPSLDKLGQVGKRDHQHNPCTSIRELKRWRKLPVGKLCSVKINLHKIVFMAILNEKLQHYLRKIMLRFCQSKVVILADE
jgi:hypothetical protein